MLRSSPLLFLLLFTANSQTVETWAWKNPLPQGNTLHVLHVTPGGMVVAAGEGGMLMRSMDEGKTWTFTSHPALIRIIRGAWFVSAQEGYICGEDREGGGAIAVTTDGGASWTAQRPNVFSPLLNLCFVNVDTGFCVGRGGTLLRTTNAGTTWTAMSLGSIFTDVIDIAFRSATSGTAILADGRIFRTSDVGATWNPLHTPTTRMLRSLTYNDIGLGVAVGDSGTILMLTLEGGTQLVPPVTGKNLTSVIWTSPTNLLAVGTDSVVLTSSTSGGSWNAVVPGSGADLNDIDATGSGEILGIGPDGIIVSSSDTGQTWQSSLSGAQSTVHAVVTRSGGTAVAVGQGGRSFVRDAGTTSWTVHEQQFSSTMYACTFASDSVVIAAGSGGRIYRSQNAGSSWTEQTSGSLSTVFGIDEESGTIIAVGASGTILRSTDGGVSWTSQASGSGLTLRAVSFAGPDTVIAVGGNPAPQGANPVILRSTDDGLTWNTITAPTATVFASIVFSDAHHGLIGGTPLDARLPAIYLTTTDGGLTWTSHQIAAPPSINPFAFFTINTIASRGASEFLAGSEEGVLFSTTNGGASWRQVLSGTGREIRSIVWARDRWIAVGAGGMIIESPRDTSIVKVAREDAPSVAVSPLILDAFPNPFNPSTTIQFMSFREAEGSVRIYDILGRPVREIFRGPIDAGRLYAVEFEASGLPSGQYLVVITQGSRTLSRRILLLK